MFKKLIASLGIGAAAVVPGIAAEPPGPYPQKEINFIYNLLFCDNPARFRPRDGEQPTPWQRLLFNEKPDARAVAALAEDQTQESRVRVLAYNWLSRNHHPVPKRKLLGVVVEVGFDAGLDTLAASRMGAFATSTRQASWRCSKQRRPTWKPKLRGFWRPLRLQSTGSAVGQAQVATAVQWEHSLTFLVSDGLYFGEGRSRRCNANLLLRRSFKRPANSCGSS
jgi:hypothetical protein